MRISPYYFFLFMIIGCVPPGQNKTDELITIDWAAEDQQAILRAQDERDATALLPFMISDESAERLLAVRAAASMKSDKLYDELLRLLREDVSPVIKEEAAYALGQQKDTTLSSSLITAFQQQDTSNYNTPVRGAILEAIGKSGDSPTLNLIAGVSTYESNMTHLLLGQARAIYRYGLRGIRTKAASDRMIQLLSDDQVAVEVRRVAAQYIHRFSDVDLSGHINALANVLSVTTDVDIKMCIGGALARSGDAGILNTLSSILEGTDDYRVKVNILRRLGSFQYNDIKDLVYRLVDAENEHIWPLATDIIYKNLPRQEIAGIIEKARLSNGTAKGAMLYGAALNSLPSRFINSRANINRELKQSLDSAKTVFVQAHHINALATDPSNLQTIIDRGLQAEEPYLRTASLLSIERLMTNTRSKQIYARPSAYNVLRNSIAQQFIRLLEGGDAGDIANICGLIVSEELKFKDVPGLNTSIRSAMRLLSLPRETETYKACQRTIAYLEDGSYEESPPVFNHEIDMNVLSRVTDSTIVYVVTNKGTMTAELYPDHAPGSVANFIDLLDQGFYSQKTWHRVVPNFVIQTGCPRGDGYGSLDYTIRSELSQLYYDEAGYLGMASAGPDTEGTQWFITHSGTPHLDGRYTIFGKIVSGMEVVHDLLQGDIIQEVRIQY